MKPISPLYTGKEAIVRCAVQAVLNDESGYLGNAAYNILENIKLAGSTADTSIWTLGTLLCHDNIEETESLRQHTDAVATFLYQQETATKDTSNRLEALQEVVYESVVDELLLTPVTKVLFRTRGENGFYLPKHLGIDHLEHPDATQSTETSVGCISFAYRRYETFVRPGYEITEILAVLTDKNGTMLAHLGAVTAGRAFGIHDDSQSLVTILDAESEDLGMLAGGLVQRYGNYKRNKRIDCEFNELFDQGDLFYLTYWDRQESVRGQGIGMHLLEESIRFTRDLCRKRPIIGLVADLSPTRFAYPVYTWGPSWLLEDLKHEQAQLRGYINERKPYRLFGEQAKLYEIDLILNNQATEAVEGLKDTTRKVILETEEDNSVLTQRKHKVCKKR